MSVDKEKKCLCQYPRSTDQHETRSTTRTVSVATPTAVTIGGAAAMSIVEDPDMTIQGRITEVRNIPIATDYTTSTTSLTVGKFTQVRRASQEARVHTVR